MTRFQVAIQTVVGLVLMTGISCCWAQQSPEGLGVMTQEAKNGTIHDNKLMDASVIGVSDPSQVDMLFKEGDSITSVLEGLNEKGFHIQYRKKQFSPEMILLSLPTATDIDGVLREMLEPYNFTIYRTPYGKVIVTPAKKKPRKVDMTSPDTDPTAGS